jgi:hypothetical protein
MAEVAEVLPHKCEVLNLVLSIEGKKLIKSTWCIPVVPVLGRLRQED